MAVNFLELEDVRNVIEQIKSAGKFGERPLKEKAAYVTRQFQNVADTYGIVLSLDKVTDGKIVEHGGAVNTFETLFQEGKMPKDCTNKSGEN